MRIYCGSIVLVLVLLGTDAEASWPGKFVWQPQLSPQREKAQTLSHRGQINWVSKFHELSLNQPKDYERTRTIAWDYSREIQAVRRGRVVRDKVRVNSWSWLEQDGLEDKSLAGYTFAFRDSKGRKRRQTKAAGPEKMSANAESWATHHLQDFDELLLSAIRPRKSRLHAGESWEVDALQVAIALQLDTLSRVDPEKSRLQGRLDPPQLVDDVFVGRYVVEGELTLGQFANTKMPWKSGGKLKLKIEVDGPLEPVAVRPYNIRVSGYLQGSTEVKDGGGAVIVRDIEWRMDGTWSRNLP